MKRLLSIMQMCHNIICHYNIPQKWKSHYFVLTRQKLYYVEPKPEEEDDDEEDNIYGSRDSVILYQDSAYEMHFGETWFHGRLRVLPLKLINNFIYLLIEFVTTKGRQS